MFNQNFLARTSSHYLTVLVLCSGSFFSESSVVLANQNVQTNINSSTQDKVATSTATSTATASSPVLPAALNLIKQHEGFRSYAYIDSNGLPVIGYGQSIVHGKTVTMGQYITQAQADAALAIEVEKIQRLVLNTVRVDLNVHQLAALTSFVYNAGTRVITNSTLSRKLNLGDFSGAAREFPRWNKANQGGQLVVFPGLTRRRIAEQTLFLTPIN